MKKTGKSGYAGLVLLLAAVLAATALFSKITVYCDDYLYGTFFKKGFSGFWKLTKWHYENYNGRVLVHLAAQLALLADKYVYMFLAPLMLAMVFTLGQTLQNARVRPGLTLAAAGASVAAVTALPVRFLRSSLLWISAGFNYLFPLAVILPGLWLLKRDIEARKVRLRTLLVCFLCGATTEQSGVAAMVLLGGYALMCAARGEIPLKKAAPVPLLIAAGYLTVLLAPGTWVRVGNETGGGILQILRPEVLGKRLSMSLEYFTGASGLPWLFAVFAALTALHALLTGKAPKALAAGFGAAALYLLLRATGRPFPAACLGVLWMLFTAAVYLFRRETAVRGLLLGAALASLLVMAFTTTAAERTTIPAILLTICVCASLASECLERAPDAVSLPLWGALAAAFLVLAVPTYRGYAQNSPVWEENARRLREHDTLIVLNMDIDRTYAYTSYLDSLTFLRSAMDYYGVTDEKITYTSSAGAVSGTYGSGRAGLPVYVLDGTAFAPIQDSVLLSGGESEWDDAMNGTWAKCGEREYILRPNGEVVPFDAATRTVTGPIRHTDVRAPVYTYYAPMDVMTELFGIRWDYDEAENIYTVRKGR